MKRVLLICGMIGMAGFLLTCSRGGGGAAPPPPPDALTWTAPQLLENSATDAREVQIAVDAAGNALVVWLEDPNIYANRYRAAAGAWDAAPTLVGTDASNLALPRIAVNAQGNGICVWEGSGDNVRYALFNAATGTWSMVQSLTSTTSPVSSVEPSVAMDTAGNAMVVWMEWSMSTDDVAIKARRMSAGGSWDSIVTLQTNSYPGSYIMPLPRVAMDSQGNALAVWLHTSATDTSYHIQGSMHTTGSGTWTPAQALEDLPGDALLPRIAMDAAGDAIVVWRNAIGTTAVGVYANRYSPGAGWLPSAELVSQQTVTALYPAMVVFSEVDCAITANGDNMVVYGDFDGSDGIVYATRRAKNGGWSTVAKIDALNGVTLFPQVSMDAGGNAVALWAQSEGTALALWSNNYVAGQGWSTAQRVASSVGQIAATPWWHVAFGGSGPAFAVWTQAGGVNNAMSIHASRGH